MRNWLTLLLLLSACKSEVEIPPPIRSGKCLVDQYVGVRAAKQACSFQGYTWACTDDGTLNICTRGAEVGGERAAPVKAP